MSKRSVRARIQGAVRGTALLPALLLVSGWVVSAPAAAIHLSASHGGLGAGRPPIPMAQSRQGLSLSQVPTSLAAVIRQTLSRQNREDYRIQAQGTRFVAANPSQHLQIAFTAAGPRLFGSEITGRWGSAGGAHRSWIWGMRLVGIGRSRMEGVAHGQMALHGSEVVYRHGSITEWYRNSSAGLEQGFTLRDRPAGPSGDAIRLELRLSGSVRAHLERGGQAVRLSQASGRSVLRYTGLAVRDARGHSLVAHLEVLGTRLELVVSDQGARYPIQIDPWMRKAQLNLRPGAADLGDQLGKSVALSSDGNTALLGVPGRRVNGRSNAGAGEVFVRSGSTWTYQTQLDLGTGAAYFDQLGSSAALSSDGTTALLGALDRTVNGPAGAGAGEVFVRSGSTWTYQTQLDLGTGAAYFDQLGSSAALSSDGNTALLGVSGRRVNGRSNAGAGEVFVRSGSTWTRQAQLDLGTGVTPYDQLGTSVALSSDGTTALLGALARTVNGQSHAGAGEVFVRSGSTWTYQTQLDLGTGAASYDQLGYSAALSSDGNTALLGAPGRTVGGASSAGAGEVFVCC